MNWEFGTIRSARDGHEWGEFSQAIIDRDRRGHDRDEIIRPEQFSVQNNVLSWEGVEILEPAQISLLERCDMPASGAQALIRDPDITLDYVKRWLQPEALKMRLYNQDDESNQIVPKVRGVVSVGYKDIPGSVIVNAVESSVDISKVRLSRFNTTPYGFSGRAIDITSEFDVNLLGDPGPVPDDVLFSGWDLKTSDVGGHSALISSLLFRLVCNNGSTSSTVNATARMVHRGKTLIFKGDIRSATEWMKIVAQAKADKFLLPSLEQILINLSVLQDKPSKEAMRNIYDGLQSDVSTLPEISDFEKLLAKDTTLTPNTNIQISRWDFASAFALAGGTLRDPRLERYSARLLEDNVESVFPMLLNTTTK